MGGCRWGLTKTAIGRRRRVSRRVRHRNSRHSPLTIRAQDAHLYQPAIAAWGLAGSWRVVSGRIHGATAPQGSICRESDSLIEHSGDQCGVGGCATHTRPTAVGEGPLHSRLGHALGAPRLTILLCKQPILGVIAPRRACPTPSFGVLVEVRRKLKGAATPSHWHRIMRARNGNPRRLSALWTSYQAYLDPSVTQGGYRRR